MYYVDLLYYKKNGQTYGDLEYSPKEIAYPTLKEAIEAIEFSLSWKMDGSIIHRTEDNTDPCILSVIDDRNEVQYRIANCSEEVAKEYGIKADKYIETLKEEE